MVIPNNIFLNKNELPVKAHFWIKAATPLLSGYLLLASGTHRWHHHVGFTDWLNVVTGKPCQNWLTKSYIPLIVNLYQSNTLNCHTDSSEQTSTSCCFPGLV